MPARKRKPLEADDGSYGGAVLAAFDALGRKCRVCGCTELAACEGGCSWVEEDLCSACVKPASREPMRRGHAKDKESAAMELPEGKTCADCVHCNRCCVMFGHIPEDEVCDWYPSRFFPLSAEAAP